MNVNTSIGTTNVSFTPAYFRMAFKLYEDKDYRPLIRMIEKSEMDSMIAGCLAGREAGYARDWRIVEASESPQDIEAKEFIESVFLNLDMLYLFDKIFEAKKKIYSVIDLTWEIENGKQIITNIEMLHQKYFRYDGKELKVDWGKLLKPIEKDSALVCEYKEKPILLPPLRDYILKEFGIESWSSFIETFGEPLVIGKYPQGADKQFQSELQAGVNAIASSSKGIVPEGTEINIVEAQRNTGDHQKYTERADSSISIAILGHADAVSGSKGTQIGDNQSAFRVRREIAIRDIRYIEQHVSRLIKMLCDRNFTVKKYPVFSIDKSEPINVKERLATIDSGWEKGFIIDPSEYGKLGLHVSENQQPLINPLIGI